MSWSRPRGSLSWSLRLNSSLSLMRRSYVSSPARLSHQLGMVSAQRRGEIQKGSNWDHELVRFPRAGDGGRHSSGHPSTIRAGSPGQWSQLLQHSVPCAASAQLTCREHPPLTLIIWSMLSMCSCSESPRGLRADCWAQPRHADWESLGLCPGLCSSHARATSLLLILTKAVSMWPVRKPMLTETSGLEALFHGTKKAGYPWKVQWRVLEGEDRDFSTGDSGGDQLIISVYGPSPPGRIWAFRGQNSGLFCSWGVPKHLAQHLPLSQCSVFAKGRGWGGMVPCRGCSFREGPWEGAWSWDHVEAS